MKKAQFSKHWKSVRSSFWFLPGCMAGAAVALALVSVTLDEPMREWLERNWGWTFIGGAEGANAVMGIVAGSMITIAGVVFSMTLVALSLASSQLGPRLLRSFMRDSTTQVVLGMLSLPSCTACLSPARSAMWTRSLLSRTCRSPSVCYSRWRVWVC